MSALMVMEKPILFSTKMVQAIMAGNKTMTRRVIKQSGGWDANWNVCPVKEEFIDGIQRYEMRCGSQYSLPWFKCKWQVGDVLWVKETFKACTVNWQPMYKADYDENSTDYKEWKERGGKWKPSLFMPRKLARIFLEITDIKVERVQDISEQDAITEGIKFIEGEHIAGGERYTGNYYENYLPTGYISLLPKDSFKSLWISINGKESWDSNPWVFAITFKQTQQ